MRRPATERSFRPTAGQPSRSSDIPARGGVDQGQPEARLAQKALAGATVGGASVRVTGLDALRATGNDTQGTGTGVLIGTLLAALGALLVLVFVFRSFTAVIPLLMAAVAIPTTFLLIWPLTAITDVSVIVQFLVALIGSESRSTTRC